MKLKLKGRRFDTIEEIQAETPKVFNTLTEKDFQEAFQKCRRRWDRCLHAGGTTSRVTAADGPYGNFYDFYSVSPYNFGSTLVILPFKVKTNRLLVRVFVLYRLLMLSVRFSVFTD